MTEVYFSTQSTEQPAVGADFLRIERSRQAERKNHTASKGSGLHGTFPSVSDSLWSRVVGLSRETQHLLIETPSLWKEGTTLLD